MFELTVQVHHENDGETVLGICGEADLATAPVLERAMVDAPAADGSRLVLDCRALEFMDCAALGVLARYRLRRPDVQLVLRAPGGVVARLLEVVGWAGLVDPA